MNHFYCIARLNDEFEWEQLTALKQSTRGYEYYSDPDRFEFWCQCYPNSVVEIIDERMLNGSDEYLDQGVNYV